jgi:hypothetical protein
MSTNGGLTLWSALLNPGTSPPPWTKYTSRADVEGNSSSNFHRQGRQGRQGREGKQRTRLRIKITILVSACACNLGLIFLASLAILAVQLLDLGSWD